MNAYRKIERVSRGASPHWVGNGFYVNQYFPKSQPDDFYDRMSPFLLLDYNAPYFFRATPFETGVGAHPHRGFETVTFSFAGKVAHMDNKGNSGVIEAGDIQWMSAKKGIIHKEYHEKEYAKKDRVFHVLQLWINLPKKDKMGEARYQTISKYEMGHGDFEHNEGSVIVYAGEAFGIKGPVSTHSPMNIYKVKINRDKTLLLNDPAQFNTAYLVLGGKMKVNGQQVSTGDFVLLENDGNSEVLVEGLEGYTEFMVFSGAPLNEPVVAIGPFVMNSYEEIQQANKDFENGVFGEIHF